MVNYIKSKVASDLLALPAPEFVSECYRLILGREADQSGINHYLPKVVRGEDRLSIAAAIASSPEARILPSSKKRVVAEILAMHATAMALKAWTPARRRKLANRINLYFSVLSRSIIRNETDARSQAKRNDPFSDYLKSVIEN
jgi:hypothetical protein